MKRLLSLGVCALFAVNVSAQDVHPILVDLDAATFKTGTPRTANVNVPQGVSYQAVARNASGEILANQAVGLRVSVLANSATGDVRYTETHSVTSDAFGVLSFVIGGGTPAGGTFSNIDWNGEAVFVKLEADFAGGTTYADLGASRVWSVPFALAAGNAFDPSIPRIINSDEGDSAIVTRVSGNKTALAYQNYITTNSPSAGGTFTHVTPAGTTPTFIYGTYSRVTGQNNASATNGTGTYAGYNVAEGTSKIKMGSIGFALGEGSGEIVPFGDPQEVTGNFGSINYGSYGVARGNSNLNIGVFGRADGSTGGARGNVGVEAQGFVLSDKNNFGMVASAGRSSVRNIGINARANGATAGDNIGAEISVNNASGNNLGLIVNANGTNATAIISNGNMTVNGNITHSGTITQSSDRTLKEGIAPLESTLSKLLTMNVVQYQYRQDTGLFLPTGTHYGVIAQELEPLFPELVTQSTARIPNLDAADAGPSTSTTTIEYKSVNYTEMIPVLIKAIQEQQQQIEVLKAEIEKLKNN
jgi:hypothetical protein